MIVALLTGCGPDADAYALGEALILEDALAALANREGAGEALAGDHPLARSGPPEGGDAWVGEVAVTLTETDDPLRFDAALSWTGVEVRGFDYGFRGLLDTPRGDTFDFDPPDYTFDGALAGELGFDEPPVWSEADQLQLSADVSGTILDGVPVTLTLGLAFDFYSGHTTAAGSVGEDEVPAFGWGWTD